MKVNFLIIKKNFDMKCANYLRKKIDKSEKILIPGGNSIKKIYNKLSKNLNYSNKIFYISDERLKVPYNQTNYKMIKNNFIMKKKVVIKYFSYDGKKPEDILKYYLPLPNKFDLSILSFGKDGHVSSIFFDKRYFKNFNKFEFTKHNLVKRITISREALKNSKDIQILCLGYKRGALLKKFYNSESGIFKIFPVGLTFILDEKAFNGFVSEKKNDHIRFL